MQANPSCMQANLACMQVKTPDLSVREVVNLSRSSEIRRIVDWISVGGGARFAPLYELG